MAAFSQEYLRLNINDKGNMKFLAVKDFFIFNWLIIWAEWLDVYAVQTKKGKFSQ